MLKLLVDDLCPCSSGADNVRRKAKRPAELGVLGITSLTMSYFHTGTRTIIGAEAFHCPVRDGKEWDHLAMVIRHNLLLGWGRASQANSQSIESDISIALDV